MAKFKLEFNTDNAAFEGDDRDLEIVRILRETALMIENKVAVSMSVSDINGNRIGNWAIMPYARKK